MSREQTKEKLVERPIYSDIRIQQAIDNEEANILVQASLPDKRLAGKIEAIDLQSEIALRKRMDESIALLETWRAQVIAARIYKAENKIPDAPNEIDLAIADIETTLVKAEEREETSREDETRRRDVFCCRNLIHRTFTIFTHLEYPSWLIFSK